MPVREFVLISSLTPDQVAQALHRRSELRGADARPIAALFEGGEGGSISRERFELQLIGRRNHARAQLRGRIAGADAGSSIAVQVGVSDAFGVLWSAGCVVCALVALLSIRSWAQVPAGLGIAAAALALFAFKQVLSSRAVDLDAATAELALKDVLSAETAIPGNGA
jgi:hypothetical protein